MKTLRQIISGRQLITVHLSTSILDAVRVMARHRIGAVPVVDDSGQVVGIFTERDLMVRVVAVEMDLKTPISEVMTAKLIKASIDDSPAQCLRKMKEKRIRHLLVVEKRKIVGIVSQRDLIESELKEKTRDLQAIDA
ncbi:MAG: CBS domain-containing protein [Acidobacteriota bacterium]|nr:CBS domain-containing protein [Blastocatellia bacterium]MDW8411317.1 CBS domain-containing protein [Acidobacteriota bacterium]